MVPEMSACGIHLCLIDRRSQIWQVAAAGKEQESTTQPTVVRRKVKATEQVRGQGMSTICTQA